MAYKPGHRQTTTSTDQSTLPAGDLLQLLIEQLDAAMADNNGCMQTLIECHQNIADRLKIVQQDDIDNDTRARIQQELNQTITQMVVAFQQHDAFNQRLQHAVDALAETKGLIEDETNNTSEDKWQQLAQKINNHYTTIRERQVLQLNQGKPSELSSNQKGNIELF